MKDPQNATDSSWNLAFEKFANYKTGINKTWQDFISFGDSCIAHPPVFTSGAVRDTLEGLLKDFKYESKPGRVSHSLLSEEGKSYSWMQVVHDGVVNFPDSIRMKAETWYNNFSTYPSDQLHLIQSGNK